jgi:hypothetical protein
MPVLGNPSQHRSHLTANSLVARREGYLTAEVDNEIVALNIDKGTCYGLNKTASRIWDLIEGPTRINDICAALVERYEIERSTCESEVLDLLEQLRAEGLIATPGET